MQQMAPLIIGNWKMNPGSKKAALSLYKSIKKALAREKKLRAIIAPPFPYLDMCAPTLGRRLLLGAQDIDIESNAPLTAGVSPSMVRDLKVSHVIVGHSERRARGETDASVGQKVSAVHKENMTAVICVGERDRDHSGKYFGVVEAQVLGALGAVSRAQLARVVIAYEPVWAISRGDGHGQTATADTAHEMKLFIQKVLVGKYGRTSALRVPIIYGGSVNKENALELLSGAVDGFLVGGASIKADAFISILKTAATYGRRA